MAAKIIKFGHFFLIIIVLASLAGCIDKNIGNIGDNSYLTPEHSIPLGSSDIYLKDIVQDNFPSLTQIPDTSVIDTINTFYFDTNYYKNLNELIYYYPTKDFNIGTIVDSLDYVTSLVIRTNCINNIPGKLSLQLYFWSFDNQLIDSVFIPDWWEISASQLEGNEQIVTKDTPLTQKQIQNLYNVAYLELGVKLETDNYWNNKVKYYSDQKAWLQVGIRLKLDLPLNKIKP